MAKQAQAVGRRKTSVARVYLRPGKGRWEINGRPLAEYFPRSLHAQKCRRPLEVGKVESHYDVLVNVSGGGSTGQAGAIQLGVARALVKTDESLRGQLKDEGLLTRDPRAVERKKYGRPKARKRFQFSKR
ncbi:MAG TPA: 30S ribosomal protein S9 [Gemmatimonadota bacterium]|nr:30S ribosomal protein S9 [Gemmatimonadota bacterium]